MNLTEIFELLSQSSAKNGIGGDDYRKIIDALQRINGQFKTTIPQGKRLVDLPTVKKALKDFAEKTPLATEQQVQDAFKKARINI